MQEEFDRYTGYWWSPKCEDGIYRILYLEVDHTKVHKYNLVQPGIKGEVDAFNYPLVGMENAKSRLCLVEMDTTGGEMIVKKKMLWPSLAQAYPWVEYVPRVGWMPDGKR